MKPAIALLSLALPVAAAASVPVNPGVDQAFGSTVVSTYPDGRTGLLWLKKDGTYTAKGRTRTPSNGTWRVRGDKMCLKQSRPIPVPFSFCTPLPSGPHWTAKATTGETIDVKIVPGVVNPDPRPKTP